MACPPFDDCAMFLDPPAYVLIPPVLAVGSGASFRVCRAVSCFCRECQVATLHFLRAGRGALERFGGAALGAGKPIRADRIIIAWVDDRTTLCLALLTKRARQEWTLPHERIGDS
eukprot:3562322-Pleurochrysis_carterae.AAC.2